MFKIAVFFAALGASVALDCIQIPDSKIKVGTYVTIPDGAQGPMPIPPNYNCVYKIRVPEMVYAHVRLESVLRGGNDLITVIDALGKKTLVSSRNPGTHNFYVFPNTTTTIQVTTKSVDNGSKFRIAVFYMAVPSPLINNLKTGTTDLRYFFLNDLQLNSMKQPVNEVGDQQLVLTIAQSHSDTDNFFNYFIVDGTLAHNKGVYHMSDYLNRNFVSSGSNLTVLGLDNMVSESSVIFTPLSDFEKYDGMDGMTTYYEGRSVTVDANGQKRKALTVISHRSKETILFGMTSDGATSSCSILAVQAPPTPNSAILQDLRQVTDFPHTIPYKKFSIVVENCSATFTMVSPTTDN